VISLTVSTVRPEQYDEVAELTDGAGNEERAPDVRYRWMP
jgi:hypothetical protein